MGSVVHTITNSIKIEGRQCNNSLNLAFDEPAEAWLTELMLKEAQCVTPWTGIGQKVCNERKKAMKLVKLEEKFFLGVPGNLLGYPCSGMGIQLSTGASQKLSKNFGKIAFRFRHTVTSINSSIPYGFLSMVAEIGGYVGLFLGVSFLNLLDLVHFLFILSKEK